MEWTPNFLESLGGTPPWAAFDAGDAVTVSKWVKNRQKKLRRKAGKVPPAHRNVLHHDVRDKENVNQESLQQALYNQGVEHHEIRGDDALGREVSDDNVVFQEAPLRVIDTNVSNSRKFDTSDSESEASESENSSQESGYLPESSPGCLRRQGKKTKRQPLASPKAAPARKKNRRITKKVGLQFAQRQYASDTSVSSDASGSSGSESSSDSEQETSLSPSREADAVASKSKMLQVPMPNASELEDSSSDSSDSESSDSESESSESESASDQDAEDQENDDPEFNPNPGKRSVAEWVRVPGGSPAWWTEEIECWLESSATISGQKKSAKRLKRSIHYLIVFLKRHKPEARRVKKVKPKDLRAWIRQLEAQLRKDSKKGKEYTMTQNVKRTHMIAIKSFWTSLVNNLSVRVNVALPLKLPPKPQAKHVSKFTSDETRLKFLKEAKRNGTVHTGIIGLLLFAGLRVNELVCLKKSDVLLEKVEGKKSIQLKIREEGAKYEKVRELSLGKHGVKYLWSYIKQLKSMNSRKNEYLFPARWTRKTKGRGHRSTDSVYRMIKNKYASKFNTEHTPHWLRHAFATTLNRRGQDEKEIQVWMGHSSVKTTRGYIQHNPEAEMLE